MQEKEKEKPPPPNKLDVARLRRVEVVAEERQVLLDDAEPALVVDDDAALAALLDGSPIELAPARRNSSIGVPTSRHATFTSSTSLPRR